jgi:hypothetical protein
MQFPSSGLPRQEPEANPALDERLPALALGAFEVIEMLIVSTLARVPYTVIREVAQLTDDQRADIRRVAQKAADAHARFFAEHEDEVAFGIGLAAIQAVKLDQILLFTADERPFSPCETFGILAIMFAPLLIVLLLYALKRSGAGS